MKGTMLAGLLRLFLLKQVKNPGIECSEYSRSDTLQCKLPFSKRS